MMRGRLPVSAVGVLGVAVVALLTVAGSAAYQASARHAAPAAPVAGPVVTTLDAASAPGTVTYGWPVTVTGTLHDPAGRPVVGRLVEVFAAEPAPASRAARGAAAAEGRGAGEAVRVVADQLTDARGRVSVTFHPAAATRVWMWFPGEPGGGPSRQPWLAPAESAPVRVAVAPQVRVSARARPTGHGWETKLFGRVLTAPARSPSAAQKVRLERHDRGVWRRVGSAPLGRDGAFHFVLRRQGPGRYAYRVLRPADGPYVAGSQTRVVWIGTRPPRAPALPGLGAGTGGPGEVLVTGDSLAYYLGQQLAGARGHRPTAVDSRPSSGLARPDYFDWTAYADTQLAAAKPGAVVVFVGANDCQPLRAGGTGAWAPVGSTAWVGEYRRRAAALMRVYTGDGARPVYWIGLPIARKPDILACYRGLNSATRAAASDVPRVTWIDSWSVYAVEGHYSDYVAGVLARQEDGIHLTYDGTRLLTRQVLALLR